MIGDRIEQISLLKNESEKRRRIKSKKRSYQSAFSIMSQLCTVVNSLQGNFLIENK